MRTVAFGETADAAKQYLVMSYMEMLDGIEVVDSPEELHDGESVTVYLVGDWESNPNWQAMLSKLRCLANSSVVKVFVASECC